MENGHYQILDYGDLLIASVGSRDEGKYTCLRANEAGSISQDAWLSILGKLSWQDILKRTNINCLPSRNWKYPDQHWGNIIIVYVGRTEKEKKDVMIM